MSRDGTTGAGSASAGTWQVLLEHLRGHFGQRIFDRWLRGLSVLEASGDRLRLGVPNAFVLDWIRTRYLEDMQRIARTQLADPVELELAIDPKLFRERRHLREQYLKEDRRAPGLRRRRESSAAAKEERGFRLEDFVPGASNRLAWTAVLEVIERPGRVYNPLVVVGPHGVGKTHLLHGMRRALLEGAEGAGGFRPDASGLRVASTTAERFCHHFVASIQDGTTARFRERYRTLDVFIADDLHLLVGKKRTQVEFLHTFDALVARGKQVIVSTLVHPRRLEGIHRALVDRLLGGLVAPLELPDYEARLEIARQEASRLGGRLPAAVLEFVAESVRGSAGEVMGAVKRLDVEARVSATPLSVDAAHRVLAPLLREQQRRVTIERIHKAVADHYGLDPRDLVSSDRRRHIAFARQVAMYLARRYLRKPLAEIGKYFGNRNHATVRCAEAKISQLLKQPGSSLVSDLRAIVESLYGG